MDVRTAAPDDLERIRDIERAAGQLFVEVGMPDIADDEPTSVATLTRHAEDGRLLVLVDPSDRPVGAVLIDVVGACAHIEELSVDPEHHRHGYGKVMITHVADWARRHALPAITLTTFRDVPWNAPYYERLGFRILAEAELTPELRSLRAREAEHGLDPDLRVCMRLDLPIA